MPEKSEILQTRMKAPSAAKLRAVAMVKGVTEAELIRTVLQEFLDRISTESLAEQLDHELERDAQRRKDALARQLAQAQGVDA